MMRSFDEPNRRPRKPTTPSVMEPSLSVNLSQRVLSTFVSVAMMFPMQWGLCAARTPCRDRHNCHYTNKLTWKKTPVWGQPGERRPGATLPVRDRTPGNRFLAVATDEAITNNDVG